MKRTVVPALLLALSATTALSAAMNHKVAVAHVGGKVRWSQVALGPDSIAHVVFVEILAPDTRNPLYYVSYDGQRATPPLMLTASLEDFAMQPHIAAGANGQLAVVWSEPRKGAIFLRMFDPVQDDWLPAERVTGMGLDEPHVVVGTDGDIHVYFYDVNDGRCYVRSKVGGSWQSEFLLSRADVRCLAGGIALADDGAVWAIWVQQDCSDPANCEYKAHFRKRTTSGTWLPQRWINEEGLSQERPAIGVGPNGVPWISWGDVTPTESTRVVAGRLDEAQNPIEYVTGSWTQHSPRVAVDINNNCHLAVQQGPGDEGDGLLYVTNASGGWSTQMMDGPWTKAVGISADGFGNVAVSWSAFLGAAGSNVYINSLEPISPKYLHPPVDLSLHLTLGSVKRTPRIAYNLSWAANPENDDRYMRGYRIYMKEDGGNYQQLLDVSQTTFSQRFEFSNITPKRRFAITSVNSIGAESVLTEF